MSRAWIGLLAVSFALVGVAAASPDETTIEDRLRAQLLSERADKREQRMRHADAMRQADARYAEVTAGLRRTIRTKPAAKHAVRLAATLYDIPVRTLWNVGWCESKHDEDAIGRTPIANGERARGWMQIIPSTFRLQTTFGAAGWDIYDPYANVLGAAQIMDADRARGFPLLKQWACPDTKGPPS